MRRVVQHMLFSAGVLAAAACLSSANVDIAELQEQLNRLRAEVGELREVVEHHSHEKPEPEPEPEPKPEPDRTVPKPGWFKQTSEFQRGVAKELNEYQINLLKIGLGETGADVCQAAGMSCIAVEASKSFDERDRFCGYTVPSCNSKVRKRRQCMKSGGRWLNHAIDRTRFRRSREADRGADCGDMLGEMCLHSPVYSSAICINAHGAVLKVPNLE